MSKSKYLEPIIFIIPLAFVLTFTIGLKWQSKSEVDWPSIYGMFYPVSSNAIGSSFGYEYYIKGIIINILSYSVISGFLYFIFLKQISKKVIKRIIIGFVLIAFIGVLSIKGLFIQYSNIIWDYDKTTIFEKVTLFLELK